MGGQNVFPRAPRYTVPFRRLTSTVTPMGGTMVWPIHMGFGLSEMGLIS